MEIRTTPHFDRSYKKLSLAIRKKAKAREELFRNNPFDPRLGTHKLHGERKDEWAYAIDRSYRIVFVFLEADVVLYFDIGTHDELYR